jgi:hypothetical protein
MIIQNLAFRAAGFLAASPVNDPGIQSPVSSTGINLLLGYAKWGSLMACAAAALVSGGMIAFGQLSNRPDAADKGKRALLWALGGAAVVALAIPTLNTIFGAA